MQFVSQSIEETAKIASDFVGKLVPRGSGATVVGLYGDLGVGKTTFTQAVARVLGIKENVTSPTFVIEKIYELVPSTQFRVPSGGFSHLVHIDAYRLKDASELGSIGWDEIVRDSNNLILVEWAERIQESLPDSAVRIRFEHVSDKVRQINVDQSF